MYMCVRMYIYIDTLASLVIHIYTFVSPSYIIILLLLLLLLLLLRIIMIISTYTNNNNMYHNNEGILNIYTGNILVFNNYI